MAYDADRGRVVLFGGSGTNPNVAFGETWEFDGTRWQRAATSGPTGRVHHALQYDAQARRTVMYGGFVPGSAALGETWTWSATTNVQGDDVDNCPDEAFRRSRARRRTPVLPRVPEMTSGSP